MIVVSDTSPINYLVWIGAIGLLPRLYDSVILPQAVYEELTRPEAPAPVRAWATQLPEWATVSKAETLLTLPGLGLMIVHPVYLLYPLTGGHREESLPSVGFGGKRDWQDCTAPQASYRIRNRSV